MSLKMKLLKKRKPASGGYHGIFSTHPSTENRIEAMKKQQAYLERKIERNS